MEFHELSIKEINKDVPDCSVISFDVPEELRENYQFTQGQFLTVQTTINGEKLRRSYSLCSSPLDNKWTIGVKRIPLGLFSNYAYTEMTESDSLEVALPEGKFFIKIEPETKRTLAFFAAGSGITPVLSLIKTHLMLEKHSKIKLFYSNKRVSTMMFKEELEGLKNKFMDRLEVSYFLTEEKRNIDLFNGRIDRSKLDTIFKIHGPADQIQHYFLCGPEEMIFLVRDYLLEKQVSEKNIHFELFYTGSKNEKREAEIAEQHTGKTSSLKIIEGGKSFEMTVDQGKGNILDYALQNAADLPFACKGGVCCTCKAKLIEGEVEMLRNFGLEQEELDAGYILTCQAVPISDTLKVDFDH